MNKLVLFITALLLANLIQAQIVGIGTHTPAAKLDIIGTITITDGTQDSSKVLTSRCP